MYTKIVQEMYEFCLLFKEIDSYTSRKYLQEFDFIK